MKKGSVVMDNKWNSAYELASKFKKKYKMSVAWRIKKNAKIVEKHLNPNEKILYAFTAQKNDNMFDVVSTYAVVLTNKRLILGTKRLLFGYFFTSITPDMFNDLTVKSNLVWGKIHIDTVKEYITLSNISKKALPEIETKIINLMIREKKKYHINNRSAM